jgi:hypothetical protein
MNNDVLFGGFNVPSILSLFLCATKFVAYDFNLRTPYCDVFWRIVTNVILCKSSRVKWCERRRNYNAIESATIRISLHIVLYLSFECIFYDIFVVLRLHAEGRGGKVLALRRHKNVKKQIVNSEKDGFSISTGENGEAEWRTQLSKIISET